MLALVSANLGGIDPVFPLPPLSPGLRAFYYTGAAGRVPAEVAVTWTSIIPVLPGADPRYEAKFYKCQVHRLRCTAPAEHLVWSDACMRFASLAVVDEMVHLAAGRRAVLVPHPDRATVADEYEYVLRQIARGNRYLASRYDAGALERERDHFARRHNLARLPLWCGGFWLLPRTPEVAAFLDAWWECVNTFSIFDQCAISPLLTEAGVEVAPLHVNIFSNSYFTRVPHA